MAVLSGTRAGATRPGPDAPAAGPPSRQRRTPRWALGREPVGLALASPYAAFLILVFGYPLGLAVWMSFHDWFFTAPGVEAPKPFVGLDNYRTVLTDPAVHRAMWNILVFLLINVPLTTLSALVLATALNTALPARGLFRTAYYLPYVSASVATVGVWLWLFSQGGLVNQLLGPLAPSPSWLVNSALAMPMIAVYVTWKQLGFFVLLYLAALQGVPRQLYETAAVDGAGRWRTFWSVTVPSLRPATVLVVILATITGANLFTEPYLLTGGGGPDGASMSPVLLMYQRGIQQGEPDVAAALGVLLVTVVLAVSLGCRRFLERG